MHDYPKGHEQVMSALNTSIIAQHMQLGKTSSKADQIV
jgi:hypothetical protein